MQALSSGKPFLDSSHGVVHGQHSQAAAAACGPGLFLQAPAQPSPASSVSPHPLHQHLQQAHPNPAYLDRFSSTPEDADETSRDDHDPRPHKGDSDESK